MAKYDHFETDNNKFTNDRYDIYNSAFESPLENSKTKTSSLVKNIKQISEFCAYTRWYPDIFFDMLKPETGGMNLDLYQRIMMRTLSRFPENYFCIPRGGSKTLMQIMVVYHTAICFPNITIAITASTKESAVKIWREKHDEITRFYPALKDEIKNASFAKDTGKVEFQNGSIVDNLANSQQSKGLRRRRGSLEEAALIDKDLYEDAIEPIFNVPRTTMSGEIDPTELNGQTNRFSTSGYKNSDEYEKILTMTRDMYDLKGTFVFGADWSIPVHFGRQKKSTIDKARRGNIVRFRQNYLCDWIGVGDGALINISKLMKARVLNRPELECPKDKKGNLELAEYVLGVDVARSAADSNNKTAIVIGKIIRSLSGVIRQVQLVNIIEPPNGLNFTEQSVIIKQIFYKYGGSLDPVKSRVKAIVVDANTIGQGLVDRLLENQTDPVTNEELGCFGSINTDQRSEDIHALPMVFSLKAQGINGDIIRTFIDYVESNRLKLIRNFDDMRDNLPKEMNSIEVEQSCLNTQFLIDEVANLKLKKTTTSITVEQVVRRIDKDRYSATVYLLYYIAMFLEKEPEEDKYSDDDEVIYF